MAHQYQWHAVLAALFGAFLVLQSNNIWHCEACAPAQKSGKCVVAKAQTARLNPKCTQTWDDIMEVHNNTIALRSKALRTVVNFKRNPIMMYDPFEPSFNCLLEQRVGREIGDGGKFVCGNDEYFSSRSCLAYSIGSKGDFSFERKVRRKFGCEVHTFDPTGATKEWSARGAKLGVKFHAWGLGGKDGIVAYSPWNLPPVHGIMLNNATGEKNKVMALPQIMQALGHSNKMIDILKVDCEGAEYEAFEVIWADIRSKKLRVGQVQVELHGLSPPRIHKFFVQAENAGFFVFHKERNHWGCKGYLCVEFSLIWKETAWDVYKSLVC